MHSVPIITSPGLAASLAAGSCGVGGDAPANPPHHITLPDPAASSAAISHLETNAAPAVAGPAPQVQGHIISTDVAADVIPSTIHPASLRYDYCGNRVLINSQASRPIRKHRLLLLSAGPNHKFGPLYDSYLLRDSIAIFTIVAMDRKVILSTTLCTTRF